MPGIRLKTMVTGSRPCYRAPQDSKESPGRVYRPRVIHSDPSADTFARPLRPSCGRTSRTSSVRSNPTLVHATEGGIRTAHFRRVRTLPSRVPSPPPSLLLVFTAPILLTELAIYLVFFFFFLPLALFCACPARPKHGPTWRPCPRRPPGPRLVSSGRGAPRRLSPFRPGQEGKASRISGYYSKTT